MEATIRSSDRNCACAASAARAGARRSSRRLSPNDVLRPVAIPCAARPGNRTAAAAVRERAGRPPLRVSASRTPISSGPARAQAPLPGASADNRNQQRPDPIVEIEHRPLSGVMSMSSRDSHTPISWLRFHVERRRDPLPAALSQAQCETLRRRYLGPTARNISSTGFFFKWNN